jgi:hypothetical protein
VDGMARKVGKKTLKPVVKKPEPKETQKDEPKE